jgi:hypothetical protein
MSTVKSKKLQVGTDATSSNNFTIYQPATPDGTLRIGVGNADSPTEVAQFTSSGLNASALTGSLPAGMGGKILQVVTKRSDTRTAYSGSNEYVLSELTTTITPVASSSLLMIDMHIFHEASDPNQVFKATRNGLVMTDSGYEGYNSAAGNQRWSGIAAAGYDTDYTSTPNYITLRFFDVANSTTSRTYGMNARTSYSTNQVFYLNRSGGSTGTDTQEVGVSFVTIMEIAQ